MRGISLLFLGILLIGIFLVSRAVRPASPSAPVTQSQPQTLGQQTQTSNCQVQGALPDKNCTPGAVFPDVTAAQVCASGYSRSVRNISTQTKDQVFAEYGITSHSAGQYEVDHLISLELGGSNNIVNLWPEAADPRPGFHEKDQVENYLHNQVCSGALPLAQAQQEISTNWLQIYQSMLK